ncbi:endochitinase EP3-like [Corylus avellana]|uniref:endochitinase EP3-like n=1 Tax=Corylus avellana TaxID=13451 RepID=UPI001E21DD04|nr:endochitinase EP3-like [Corylus avellana]
MEVAFMMKKNVLTLVLVGIIAGALPRCIEAQHCGCATHQCCSRWGYCGTSKDYCGTGCQEGPGYTLPPINHVSLPFLTQKLFNGIIHQADASCPGKKFYTRAAFLDAHNSFYEFGRIGSVDDSKREIAAFFGHVTHAIGHFCYIEEIDGPSKKYCDEVYTKSYPCNANKRYYGRGPLQLTWNFNYGAAGKSIGFDGLNSPETVTNDPVISFKTALWYWMKFVHPVIGEGFGKTIRAINNLECDGRNPARVKKRVAYYIEYCKQLNVSPGNNLTC